MGTARTSIRPTGETYKAADSASEAMLPAKYANHPFMYVAYTNGWEWDEADKRMLPCLSEIRITPGVNGVGDDLSPHRAIGSSVQKGGTIIRPNDTRLGEWQNFITRYKCGAGRPVKFVGWHYCFRSAGFEILPNREAAPIDGSAEFRDFRAHLVECGIISPISGPELSRLLAVERLGLSRLIGAAQNNPHRGTAVEAKRARVEAIEAWWAKDSVPDAAPRVKRTRLGAESAPLIEATP